MDYRCRLGSVSNSSTAAVSTNTEGTDSRATVRPAEHLFFCMRHSSLFTFFLCFYVLFHSCSSHAQVLGETLVHELIISYSYTKCNLISLLSETEIRSVTGTCAVVTEIRSVTGTCAVVTEIRSVTGTCAVEQKSKLTNSIVFKITQYN